MAHIILSQRYLKELLNYDAKTGKLYWKKRLSQRTQIGQEAGFLHFGYIKVTINYTHYLAHRLIWIMQYGENPILDIDHINGNRADNRLSNLRIVTRRQNTSNKACHRAGKLVGANYRPKAGTGIIDRPHRGWFSNIQIQGKRIHLGTFATELEAHQAYIKALTEAREKGFA